MTITKINFPCFEPIIVRGKIAQHAIETIKKIKSTMSYDEYAGYSKTEQQKRKNIENILTDHNYTIITVINI